VLVGPNAAEDTTMNRSRTDAEIDNGIFVPNFGSLADPEHLVEFAVAAEESGWDGLFLADHLIDFAAPDPDGHRPIADPWTALAGVATRTDHLTLGSYVTPIARRQPWQLARGLATLDRLSDGRVILGAGLGTALDFTTFGREFDARRVGRQYDEALEVITGLWSGEPFSYDGEFYTVDDAVLRPTPVQEPRIPILAGGWWPHKKPFQRGARWDGIMPQWPSMLRHFPNVVIDTLDPFFQDLIDRQRSHETEVREMLEYYHGLEEDPGEIVLRVELPSTPPDFGDLCRELGVTWLLNRPVDSEVTHEENVERIRAGPPDR
jgi:hypothetical protein